MKNWMIWAAIIILFTTISFIGNDVVNESKLEEDYYELIVAVSDLFKDHTQMKEQYYNRSYQSEAEIAELLEDKVSERGFRLVVDTLFEEYDDLFVYRQRYQEYLNDTLDFSVKRKRNNYYVTVKDTILNPALRLIPFERLQIEHQENRIIVAGERIVVEFYDEGDRQSEHHQYARYGYPPKDRISLSLTFVNQNGNYLLEDFKVKSHGL